MHSNMLNLLLGRPTSIKKEFEISKLFAVFVILVEILNRPRCLFFFFFSFFLYIFFYFIILLQFSKQTRGKSGKI